MSGKIKENDERVARMKEMLSKGGGKPLILPTKPKPKPRPKPTPEPTLDTSEVLATSANGDSGLSSPSTDAHSDPLTIELNTDSLRQFSEKFDYDFDVVTRHQILDNSALLNRAALSQSKGLQNRRLPSTVANKVPEDYTSRRRAQTYVAPSSSMKRSATQPLNGTGISHDNVDGGGNDVAKELTEEEKRQRNLAKLGIQQSNNPLSALGSILKRNSAGRGSLPRKSSKKLFDSPQSSPKPKKKTSADSSPIGTRYGSEPPEGKSPKSGGLFKGLRRSGSRSKKKGGDNDDNRSETGSLLSLPIHSTLDEQSEDIPEVKKSPVKKVTPTTSTPKSEPSTASKPVNKEKERTPPTQVTPQRVPLRGGGASGGSSSHRKTTDSAIFKESEYESLFSSTSESLFNSSELDKLLGKKKEKTPERTLDDDAAAEAKKKAAAEEEDKKKSSSMKKSVSEYNVRSNGYLGGGGMVFPSRVETKKSAADSGRKRSMKDQLHRYESYSRASRASDSTDSPPVIFPASTSSKQEDVFDDSRPSSATLTVPGVEQKGRSEEVIVEEEEEPVPGGQDEATKVAEVAVTVTDALKSSSDEAASKKEPVKETLKSSDKAAPEKEPVKETLKSSDKAAPEKEPAKETLKSSDKGTPEKEPAKETLKSSDGTPEKKPVEETSKSSDKAASEEEPVKALKAKSDKESAPPEKKPTKKAKGAGLFADVSDDDDDLFKKPTGDKKEEQKTANKKTAALFSDEEEDTRPSKATSRAEKSKEDSKMEADPLGASTDIKKEATKVEKEDVNVKAAPKNGQIEESEDDSLFSPSTPSKKKSSLFDDVDFEEPPRYNIRKRSRGKPGKDAQPEKTDDAATLEKSRKQKSEGDSLFSLSTSSKEKSSSLFDDLDLEEPPLFNIRTRGKPGRDAQAEKEDDESLFSGAKSKPKTTTTEEKKSTVDEVVKAKSEDVSDATSGETEKPSPVSVQDDSTEKSPTHNKPTETEKVAPEKPAKVAPKPSRKPVIPKEALSKSGAPGETKPSWMAELKKRKQDKESDPSSSSQKKEAKVPEWQKKALEREKKKETGKSVLSSRKEVQKSKSEQKTDLERSPRTNRRGKLANGDAPDGSEGTSHKEESKEINGSTASLSPDHSSASSPKRYKTRREKEREAKEKAEKEQEVDIKPTETQQEDGGKKEETVKATEAKSPYKTRRQREREAQELEKQQEAKGNSPYRSRRERAEDAKEKDSVKVAKEESVEERPRYKTRRQREREAKEKEEREAKEKEEREAKEKEEREAKEKEEREAKEKEEREAKEKEEREAKEKEEREANEREEKAVKAKEVEQEKVKEAAKSEEAKVTSPYKTRRQREREAKEKEEQERLAKERENSTQTAKDNVTSSSSSTSSLKGSPSRPPLKKKPSIEIVSKKIRSGSRSSDIGGDDLKSPAIKVSDSKVSDKKDNSEMDDDVFAADSARSPSHKKPKPISPRLSIELVDSDTEPITKRKHDSEASNDPLDVKIDDFEKSNLASPQNRSAASTPKSSVSSERDLTETRPFRSHTISSSRSPTPPGSGPLKLSDQVPEWKRKLMEKKRGSGSSPVHKPSPATKAEQPSAADDKIPPWKKELLAKKKTRGDGKDDAPRSSRSATVSTVTPKTSSRRSKEPAPTPDFMKEFQKKKLRSNQ